LDYNQIYQFIFYLIKINILLICFNDNRRFENSGGSVQTITRLTNARRIITIKNKFIR